MKTISSGRVKSKLNYEKYFPRDNFLKMENSLSSFNQADETVESQAGSYELENFQARLLVHSLFSVNEFEFGSDRLDALFFFRCFWSLSHD